MKKFIFQHNDEGGANGVKVICADEFSLTSNGGIIFIRDNSVVAAYATYAACTEETFALDCEAQTAAWLAEQAARGE